MPDIMRHGYVVRRGGGRFVPRCSRALALLCGVTFVLLGCLSCLPQVESTPSGSELEATTTRVAMVLAGTLTAQAPTAIHAPTRTPLPHTPTPSPTPTVQPLPAELAPYVAYVKTTADQTANVVLRDEDGSESVLTHFAETNSLSDLAWTARWPMAGVDECS